MVRELFEMARTKKACLIFFDEIDAVGGARLVKFRRLGGYLSCICTCTGADINLCCGSELVRFGAELHRQGKYFVSQKNVKYKPLKTFI